MSVTVQCDRTDCEASVELRMDDGDWSRAPDSVKAFALDGLDYGELLYAYLPAGWTVDAVNKDTVIHCPDHAGTASIFPADSPADAQRYHGD
jgi:hypothetical protein